MHILIAPNAFKNSLPAMEAATAIANGLQQSALQCTTEIFPIGDGGDGTGSILIEKLKGKIINTQVYDPLKRIIESSYGLTDNGTTAIIELANASGIKLLKGDELNPLRATTYGTGQLILQALDEGAKKIIIAVGGSATVDGGTGIAEALGVRFLDKDYLLLDNLPAALQNLAFIDISGMDKRMRACEIIVLCDVENMLLGSKGAAAVFGPQKGATPQMVSKLEKTLTVFKEAVLQQTGRDISAIKGGGAAGGTAAGLYGLLNAMLVNGIDYFLEATGFKTALEKADLLITAEGSIDAQTLEGKGPIGIAKKAKALGTPVIGLAGEIPLQVTSEMHQYFNALFPINHAALPLKDAIPNTAKNLQRTAMELGNLLAMPFTSTK